MSKTKKLLQCIRYRRCVLGGIGVGNDLRPGILLNSASIIGNYNHIGDRVMIGNATIGNYCSIAPDVKIAQSQHSANYITTSQLISKVNIDYSLLQERTNIGSDVWLGANVVVMQGVNIGHGAIVGANAVVTRDIPAYSIAVGVPAKVIKMRFKDHIVQALLQSQWWELEINAARQEVDRLFKELMNENEENLKDDTL